MENKKDYFSKIVAGLEDFADEFMDNDIYTALRLRRIANKIAHSFSHTDLLIENLDVDNETRKQIATLIKEAMKKRK